MRTSSSKSRKGGVRSETGIPGIHLDPQCVPYAVVVAGSRSGLIEATLAGLIEETTPFRELWALPGFVVDPNP